MTLAEIINACGGKVEVAYRIGRFHTFTVDQWLQRGVPKQYWDPLRRMAKRKGVTITAEQLKAANNVVKTRKK